ncbi:Na(+)/H(+) antiporter subunit F1 [Lacicoccus qingdaonensis]|uniref:Multisubunit sodium/proton antiporter, MrpF subunit n=1 Tax=Lacicoccus qingdaonensis TaxID=576118 RepID=A0A1G9IFH1_9BACL|nr:Na(+)/H(+) antiporter subunit F1 [Salinicoccus qingdaonensis]SDL23990.1 multisubunit sodium/proton antiporter, MrpF subunit [Salinicoccus qingdaonensis]
MFDIVLYTCLAVTSLSLAIVLIRAVIGPTVSDRILALDTLGMMLIGIIGLIMILQETIVYDDIALVVAIIGFVGTISMAKFLERGVVIDND